MDAYFYLSLAENAELLQGFLEDSTGSRYFLEHTRVMYGAVRQAEKDAKSGAAFLIAAEGDYSVGLVEFGVGTDAAWEEKNIPVGESQARYYRNKDTGMELAIPSPALILTGSGVAERLGALYAGAASPLQGDTLAALESHSAGFYLPKVGKTGLPPLLPPNAPIPLKEATLFADPLDRPLPGDATAGGKGEGYAVEGTLVFASGKDAMGAAFLLRMMFSTLMGAQGMSLADIRQVLKITPEGEKLHFSGITFPRETAGAILSALMTGGAEK
jgi:hypothetical protein